MKKLASELSWEMIQRRWPCNWQKRVEGVYLYAHPDLDLCIVALFALSIKFYQLAHKNCILLLNLCCYLSFKAICNNLKCNLNPNTLQYQIPKVKTKTTNYVCVLGYSAQFILIYYVTFYHIVNWLSLESRMCRYDGLEMLSNNIHCLTKNWNSFHGHHDHFSTFQYTVSLTWWGFLHVTGNYQLYQIKCIDFLK